MPSIHRVLFATDFSTTANRALPYALDIAQRFEATLHVLYAEVLYEDPFSSQNQPHPAATVEQVRTELQKRTDGTSLGERLAALEVVEAVERDVAAGPAILRYADAQNMDLIVMGTHGRRGLRHVLLGSVAEEVVRRAPCETLTVRATDTDEPPHALPSVQRLLVPVDFSEHARAALTAARHWADTYGATLDVLFVMEEPLHPAFYVGGVSSVYDIDPHLDDKADAQLETFITETKGPRVPVKAHVRTGRAAKGIAEAANEFGSDLVVMSTHGLTGLEHLLLGSVTEQVVRTVEAPVLTVPAFPERYLPDAAPAEDEDAQQAPEA
ncbi:universal stress protein [Salisaeta longa]|uniref:universal stress protein n=1 Tax=Salisaeta longa TaxID=503170 RepID=UPI0003B789A1|nr:universal stress protein [Salisaeta longa]